MYIWDAIMILVALIVVLYLYITDPLICPLDLVEMLHINNGNIIRILGISVIFSCFPFVLNEYMYYVMNMYYIKMQIYTNNYHGFSNLCNLFLVVVFVRYLLAFDRWLTTRNCPRLLNKLRKGESKRANLMKYMRYTSHKKRFLLAIIHTQNGSFYGIKFSTRSPNTTHDILHLNQPNP